MAPPSSPWKDRFTAAYGLYNTLRFWVTVLGLGLHTLLLFFGKQIGFFEEQQVNAVAKSFAIVGIVVGILAACKTVKVTTCRSRAVLLFGVFFFFLSLLLAAMMRGWTAAKWPLAAVVREGVMHLEWIGVILVCIPYALAMYFLVWWMGVAFRSA